MKQHGFMKTLLITTGIIVVMSFSSIQLSKFEERKLATNSIGKIDVTPGEDNCGLLIDGLIVDSIPCWNFSEMSVFFPIIEDWKKYDAINIVVGEKSINYQFRFTKEYFNDLFKGSSIGIVQLCKRKGPSDSPEWSSKFLDARYPDVAFNPKYIFSHETGSHYYDAGSYIFNIKIYGETISGTKEYYNNGQVIKRPIYNDGVILYKTKNYAFSSYTYKGEKKEARLLKEFISKECSTNGKKFPFVSEPANYLDYVSRVKK